MAASCSNWCHALICIFISIVLAIGAISATTHSPSRSSNPLAQKPEPPTIDKLAMNATSALRRSGYNFMATVLQISPEELIPAFNSTIFAIRDQAMVNISLPSWLMKELLHYHISPIKLSMASLLQKPVGACIPTVLHGKNLVITKADRANQLIEINGVSISHPDIVTEGLLAIHGVLAPLYSFDRDDLELGEKFIPSPICNSDSPNKTEPRTGNLNQNWVPWPRIMRLLSSNGFISFSIGLNAALDGILQDFGKLSSVTIFAPPDGGFAYVSSPSPLLERIVRFHILPGRFLYRDFVLMPQNVALQTLLPDQDLRKTSRSNFTEHLAMNNIEITEPDAFSSKWFVIHGISRAFEMVKLSTEFCRRI